MSDLKIFANNVDENALDQIKKMSSHPAFRDSKIRIMPDVHSGKGCVIGFTATCTDKIIPNVVGVDLGCGVLTCEIPKETSIDFKKLDEVIRKHIPCGREVRNSQVNNIYIDKMFKVMHCKKDLRDLDRIKRSVGTLGGGNHFIEIDRDEADKYYLIVHSGSRNLGKQVAEIYQNIAIKETESCKKDKYKIESEKLIEYYKAAGRNKEIQSALEMLKKEYEIHQIDEDMCYLSGEKLKSYLFDMQFCNDFAEVNRNVIAEIIFQEMGWDANGFSFDTVHNYVEMEWFDQPTMIRKGAISAKFGELVTIPINMKDGCIIGIGKGNTDWNCSAPHGAGRIMSRREARKNLNVEEFKNKMIGIYTTSVNEKTIDESPDAYKKINDILPTLKQTINISKILKPVYNFKSDN